MSAFSDMLFNEMNENNMSVMRVAACANISRSIVTKIVNGQKTPTHDELAAIISVIPISKAKKYLLMQELDIARFGSIVCRQLDEIIKRNELSSPFTKLSMREMEIQHNDKWNVSKKEDGIRMLKTHTEVLLYALEATKREVKHHFAPLLYTNVTSDNKILQETVISILSTVSDKVNFKICTQITKKERKGGLSNFLQILDCAPFFIGSGDILYEYTCEKSDILPFGFSDYILLSNEIIFMNDKLDRALVVTDKETVNDFTDICQTHMSGMRSLVRRYSSVFDLFDFIKKATKPLSYVCYFQHSPCVVPFMEYDQMQKIAKIDIPEVNDVLPSLYEYYNAYKDRLKMGAFTKKGLYDFVKTGILYDFPEEYVDPAPVEVRRDILSKMLSAMEEGVSDFRVINENFVDFPIDTMIDYMKDCQLMFSMTPSSASEFSGQVGVVTDEATLLEEASNFFDMLFESRYLYTKAQSLEIIKQCLNEIS